MSNWQTFETAPKDGSVFLLLEYHKQMSCCYTAWYCPLEVSETPNGIEYDGGGWVLNDDADFVSDGDESTNLYWMPYEPPE